MNIINYEALEIPIKNVESSMSPYDIEERQLIIRKVLERMNKETANLRAKEITANNIEAFGFKDIMKHLRKDDQDA